MLVFTIMIVLTAFLMTMLEITSQLGKISTILLLAIDISALAKMAVTSIGATMTTPFIPACGTKDATMPNNLSHKLNPLYLSCDRLFVSLSNYNTLFLIMKRSDLSATSCVAGRDSTIFCFRVDTPLSIIFTFLFTSFSLSSVEMITSFLISSVLKLQSSNDYVLY